MAIPAGLHHSNGQTMTAATLIARFGAKGYPSPMSDMEVNQFLDLGRYFSEFMHKATAFPRTATGHYVIADMWDYFVNSAWIP